MRDCRILVVDDEEAMREVLQVRLSDWGAEVLQAASAAEAEQVAADETPDLVISDVVLPDASGLDLLRALKHGDPDRPVILITAHGSIDAAVEAMKLGAEDFLTKPLDYPKLSATVRALVARVRERRAAKALDEQLAEGAGLGPLVGASEPMMEVYSLLQTVAGTSASVLVSGETGTGKELVARSIHELSSRRDRPFVALNLAAVPEGLVESELLGHERGAFTGAVGTRQGCFELADGGTLFLDEIAEMPLSLQPKLLRVLEEGRLRRVGGQHQLGFDVRLITATNRDPQRAVTDGLLRQDLLYRVNVFTITLPPLRERPGDLPLLAHHFVRELAAKHGLAIAGLGADALQLLERYPWPGNVRELRNVIERAVILAHGDFIRAEHLPPYLKEVRPAAPPVDGVVLPSGATVAEAERILIMDTLRLTGNNKAEAARRLGVDVKTIRNKLRAYTVDEADG